mgnify:CR=1 FL=1
MILAKKIYKESFLLALGLKKNVKYLNRLVMNKLLNRIYNLEKQKIKENNFNEIVTLSNSHKIVSILYSLRYELENYQTKNNFYKSKDEDCPNINFQLVNNYCKKICKFYEKDNIFNINKFKDTGKIVKTLIIY